MIMNHEPSFQFFVSWTVIEMSALIASALTLFQHVNYQVAIHEKMQKSITTSTCSEWPSKNENRRTILFNTWLTRDSNLTCYWNWIIMNKCKSSEKYQCQLHDSFLHLLSWSFSLLHSVLCPAQGQERSQIHATMAWFFDLSSTKRECNLRVCRFNLFDCRSLAIFE